MNQDTLRRVVLCAAAVVLLAAFPASAQYHDADTDQNGFISLGELLRVVQFYNSFGYHCQTGTEDGFAPGTGDQGCTPHDSDYLGGADWAINLSEILRVVQFFNSCGYVTSTTSEDGFSPVSCGGEGAIEGEGEGSVEGPIEGSIEGTIEGDGEGPDEGEGTVEGEGEGQGECIPVSGGYSELFIDSMKATPGQMIFQNITLHNVGACPSTMTFDLFFPSSKMTYTSYVGGSILGVADKDLTVTKVSNGQYTFTVTDPHGTNLSMAPGVLVSIVFVMSPKVQYNEVITVYAGNYTARDTSGNFIENFAIYAGNVSIGCSAAVLPTANFEVSGTSGLPGTIIHFTDTSVDGCHPSDAGAGAITAWLWDFGDGETSTEKNPSHEYAYDGTYSVSLTVNSGVGSDSITQPDLISIVAGVRVYVNKSTPAPLEQQDGETWDTAFSALQAGVDSAFEQGGGNVWVAAGTYDEARDNETGSLILKEVVRLYGGFTGTEANLTQRNWTTHPTVIDGSVALAGEPAYHVIVGANNTRLDGFMVTGGQARAGGLSGSEREGGGMYNSLVTLEIVNCTFTHNSAETLGGAISNRKATSPITIMDCVFTNNSVLNVGNPNSNALGGAIANLDSLVYMTRCEVKSNSVQTTAFWTGSAQNVSSLAFGAGLYNYNTTLTMSECLLRQNIATSQGSGSGQIGASVFAAMPDALGGGMYSNFSNVTIDKCTLRNNEAHTNNNAPFTQASGGAVYNERGYMTMTNTVVFSNISSDFSTQKRSAGIYNEACYQANAIKISNCTIVANLTDSTNAEHGGGLHSNYTWPIVTNCVFWDNSGVELMADGGEMTITCCNVGNAVPAGAGNMSVYPFFLNLSAGDFHYTAASACIDNGIDTSGAAYGSVTTDRDGYPRGFDGSASHNYDGSNYDIGAFEFNY